MKRANVDNGASYSEQMATMRAKMNGREYMKHVKELLPALTPWQIRNAVNGRTENQLVLAAIKIVVEKFEREHREALASLMAAQKRLEIAA